MSLIADLHPKLVWGLCSRLVQATESLCAHRAGNFLDITKGHFLYLKSKISLFSPLLRKIITFKLASSRTVCDGVSVQKYKIVSLGHLSYGTTQFHLPLSIFNI